MSERSEPGPTTAPGVGTVSDELLRLRPDLDEYAGYRIMLRIMLPRSYDVDMSQEGVEVLLAPSGQEGQGVGKENHQSFPPRSSSTTNWLWRWVLGLGRPESRIRAGAQRALVVPPPEDPGPPNWKPKTYFQKVLKYCSHKLKRVGMWPKVIIITQ